jgi:hypothetical protein
VLFPKNKKILTVWAGHKYVLVALKIYRCPRTTSPEKKGSILLNVIIRILKKKSPISSDNREKTSWGQASGIGEIENFIIRLCELQENLF